MKLTDGQQGILEAEGHLLITGGPGSGKTTVSIFKAARIARQLRPGEDLLFLSFARATVARVVEAIEREQRIPRQERSRIHVDTYHAFFWQFLRTHGYLAGLPRRISLLSPAGEAIALSAIRGEYGRKKGLTEEQKEEQKKERNLRVVDERMRLAREEGRVCFDLFAQFAGTILHASDRIRRLLAAMFPVIILDEFQDTNEDQWNVVQALGKRSTLIALADPEQRIYDWLGANPKRLDQFVDSFQPQQFDLSTDNHRSPGTEIAAFGNDVLRGQLRDSYQGVKCALFPPNDAQAHAALVGKVLEARKRLIATGRKDWSLAVLVPTKRMAKQVADALTSPPGKLPAVAHTAVVELEGAILAAELIALLLAPPVAPKESVVPFVDALCAFFDGRGGDDPTQNDLNESRSIRAAFASRQARAAHGKTILGNSVLVAALEVYEQARRTALTGVPEEDWISIRNVLAAGACPRLKTVAADARYIRLLERGMQLRQELTRNWMEAGAYTKALDIVRAAFVREHFASGNKAETGVIVMNMHKAKGKQFDEVIIFEGWPRRNRQVIVANFDRIVRGNERQHITEQARQTLRVAITRGKQHVTVLTPQGDPCVLLLD